MLYTGYNSQLRGEVDIYHKKKKLRGEALCQISKHHQILLTPNQAYG